MQEMSSKEIPVVLTEKLDEQFFQSRTSKRSPIIFRGVDIGSCRLKWNADYLADAIGDHEVKIHVSSQSKLDFVNRNFLYKSISLKEYIRRSSQAPGLPLEEFFIDPHEKYYLRSLGGDVRKEVADVHKQYPEIATDLNLPYVFSADRFFSSVFRIASPGSQLWTHYDVMDNLLIQILGDKEIIMFPPSDLPYLYLQGDKSVILDPDNADLSQFPLFASATKYKSKLLPGDIVYIPALWFHNVKALNFSVAVNMFWKNLEPALYDNKDVYGNKDLVPAARAQQGVDKALKALDNLPAAYKEFFTLKLISRLQASLSGSS
ncbi:tRNA wybutosine-synthesizing protein 5-like [Watersipora subatra]|uniref:tRNA wybutosine-synthesizing protein 5-like n=1 Tax=Watersipora subatra TaxID=2589382 RepID=UPI00355C2161